jgi:hypothetical protein
MFYIDVPYTYDYNWSAGKNVNAVLEQMLPASRVEFICNSGGKISTGDLYSVELHEWDTPVTFYLRTGLKLLVENEAIQQYRARRRA